MDYAVKLPSTKKLCISWFRCFCLEFYFVLCSNKSSLRSLCRLFYYSSWKWTWSFAETITRTLDVHSCLIGLNVFVGNMWQPRPLQPNGRPELNGRKEIIQDLKLVHSLLPFLSAGLQTLRPRSEVVSIRTSSSSESSSMWVGVSAFWPLPPLWWTGLLLQAESVSRVELPSAVVPKLLGMLGRDADA